VIAAETGVINTVDPLGGSYYIESLTGEIEAAAETYIARIDGMGGMLRAIETGFVQAEVQNAAYDDQRAVESGERVVVGVNRFRSEDAPMPLLRVDPALEREQVARLLAVRARRDAAATASAIAGVENAARDGANLMPPILAAVEALATVGEISDALRGVFGEYRETVVV
jgi:methylmalonyl-CoA mutase N-terminal domain/subunit